MSPDATTLPNGGFPTPVASAGAIIQSAPRAEPTMEMLRYKEELAEKMGLPSTYAMGLMKELCHDLVSSGFAPGHFKNNPMALYLAAMRGREMGLAPLESILETFWAAPGGRLGMYANKMLDLMHRKGVRSKFITETKDRCEILFTPPDGHEPYTAVFDFEEARTAMLVKADSNWIKWPSDMNKARCIARGWRALSGAFQGAANMYAKEELEDMTDVVVAATNIPTDQPVTEVTPGRRKKAATLVTVEADAPVQLDATPAPSSLPPLEEVPPMSNIKVSEVYRILASNTPDQKTLDSAALFAQALANEKNVDVKVVRITTFSDGSDETIPVGHFSPPVEMKPATPPPPVPVPTPGPAPVPATDPIKEALLTRARAVYATIPGDEKLRKQVGDMFCNGYFGVSVLREWPQRIELRTAAIDALEKAIKADISKFDSPVSARNFGRAIKAAETEVDPSAGLYKRLNWEPETCAIAALFKAKFGHEPQDFADYISGLKLDTLKDEDARAYMALGAVMGRDARRMEGSAEPVFPMKALFELGAKGAGNYSTVVQSIEMYNEAALTAIPPDKIMADLTKMLARLAETETKRAAAGSTEDEPGGWA